MMSLSSRPRQRILVNSLTDTGVSFEVGNILIAVQQSILAGVPSGMVALAAFAARAAGELKRAKLPVPFLANKPTKNIMLKLFDKMVANPNVGLEVSAIGLALASLTIVVEALFFQNHVVLKTLYHWGQEETILMTFAVANIFNGSSVRFNTKLFQNIMKAIGTIGATIGLIMVNTQWGAWSLNDPFIIPNIILVIGGVQSIYQTITESSAKNFLQPQLLLAAGCIGNSIINFYIGNVVEGFANIIWASAFISLDAIFKKGGFHEKYMTSQ